MPLINVNLVSHLIDLRVIRDPTFSVETNLYSHLFHREHPLENLMELVDLFEQKTLHLSATAFFVACANTNVPLEVISKLLDRHSAPFNLEFLTPFSSIWLFYRLRQNLPLSRVIDVMHLLFEKDHEVHSCGCQSGGCFSDWHVLIPDNDDNFHQSGLGQSLPNLLPPRLVPCPRIDLLSILSHAVEKCELPNISFPENEEDCDLVNETKADVEQFRQAAQIALADFKETKKQIGNVLPEQLATLVATFVRDETKLERLSQVQVTCFCGLTYDHEQNMEVED